MSTMPARAAVPYFCQWESAHLAGEIIRKELDLADDPAWRDSGARHLEEYVRWASHVCGMACLKMVLAARTGHAYPTLELARRSIPYGAYVEEPDGGIKGLIYAPFVRYVADVFELQAQVRVDLPAAALPALMGQAEYFMASVHPWIRWPDREPPRKGGHLVLVTRATADTVTFHNPSGEPDTQADVELPLAEFDRFFAQRGVAIMPR
ncbi:hypothetical protein [Achromobacter sp.]|uniref:hypothetical protein n=1 Tax=Achromobacter sp. TaxID=134375 RepID=UPI0028AB1C15|nr:hypothetical protein [Achromobacter sp.]